MQKTRRKRKIDEDKIWVMASDLTVECVEAGVFTGPEEHATIKAIGLAALLVVAPLTMVCFYNSMYPIRDVIETRTERKCSPLVDFALSRWKPHMWSVWG